MSKIDDLTRLRHMIDASKEAVVFLMGKSKADLLRDRLLSLALVRLLEIVGEAASRVSQKNKKLYRKFIGNKLKECETELPMLTLGSIWM